VPALARIMFAFYRGYRDSRLVVRLIDEVPCPPLVVLAHGAVLLTTDHVDEIAARGNDLPQVVFSSVVRSPLAGFAIVTNTLSAQAKCPIHYWPSPFNTAPRVASEMLDMCEARRLMVLILERRVLDFKFAHTLFKA